MGCESLKDRTCRWDLGAGRLPKTLGGGGTRAVPTGTALLRLGLNRGRGTSKFYAQDLSLVTHLCCTKATVHTRSLPGRGPNDRLMGEGRTGAQTMNRQLSVLVHAPDGLQVGQRHSGVVLRTAGKEQIEPLTEHNF